MKLSDVTKEFPSKSYCMRCGRDCSKHPQEYKNKIYGSCCIKMIIKDETNNKINEDDIW